MPDAPTFAEHRDRIFREALERNGVPDKWHEARRCKATARVLAAAARMPPPKRNGNGVVWSYKMTWILEFLYREYGAEIAALNLQVTVRQVRRKVVHMGLKMRPWSRSRVRRRNAMAEKHRLNNQAAWNWQLHEFSKWGEQYIKENVNE